VTTVAAQTPEAVADIDPSRLKTADEIAACCRGVVDLLPAEALALARRDDPGLEGFAVFPVYAPQEIIHAAGLMPLGLFGAGNRLEVMHADSRFQSFICSIAKSTLELFLRGQMEGFRGAVFSSICDVARNLASIVQRNAPAVRVEYLHLPQNAATEAARAFTRAEFARVRDNLADLTGSPIPDDAVRRSTELYNRLRALIRRLYEHRRQHPGTLGAGDLAAAVQAATRMMPEQSVPLLERLLADIRTRPPQVRDSVPVVIEGSFCEQPPLDLIDAVEAAGCRIVDDDLAIGWRLFREDVPTSGDPVANLADAYLSGSVYTSVRHDSGLPRTEGLLRRIADSGAQAVILASAKFCEPALLDYVLFRRALDERDIPHLKLEFEEKMWTFDRLRTEVETFTESMLFD
jgi:benzoyl-CoA reductase subunit C